MCSIYGICSTMQYLHDIHIIHRDYKPSNVFLDDNYDICIADFGLSRIVSQNIYLTMKKIGSPLYMAPEVFSIDSEYYRNKIDVYSFGVTYYQYFSKTKTLDDNKGYINDEINLLRRIAAGARFIKTDIFFIKIN